MEFQEFKSRFEHVKVIEFPNQVINFPVVSICIQTYNQENYISKCLDSILEQQVNFDIETIIHEDDSSDTTRQICRDYAIQFPEK